MDDALRKVLQELQERAVGSSRALNNARGLVAAKERERRVIQLTRNELSTLDEEKGERVFRGVGKMFVLESVSETIATMQKREKEITDDITSLGKKMKYLENEAAQAQAGLKEIFEHQKKQ